MDAAVPRIRNGTRITYFASGSGVGRHPHRQTSPPLLRQPPGFTGATALADLTTRKHLPEMQAAPAKKSSHGSKDEHRKPIEAEVGLRRCPGRGDQTNGCRSVGFLSTIEFALRVFESVYGIRRTLARIWLARCGLARCGLAWYGLAQCGLDRSGPARSEFARGWRPGATIDL